MSLNNLRFSTKAIRTHVSQQPHPLAEQSKRPNLHYNIIIKWPREGLYPDLLDAASRPSLRHIFSFLFLPLALCFSLLLRPPLCCSRHHLAPAPGAQGLTGCIFV
jgi:hypothetical protein